MTKRLCIVNHKGGVGKTTLTLNIASELARRGKRVLLCDTDPQCNLTAHFVAPAQLDELLDNSESDDGKTLWTALRPVADGTGEAKEVPLLKLTPNLLLLRGDIQISDFENELGDFWTQCFQRKTRGLKGTTALSQLVSKLAEKHKIDFVFYDSGPNMGPLNRIILLDCDAFIVPVACDEFSIVALKTLGRRVLDWIKQWDAIYSLAPDDSYLFAGEPKFIGYVAQRIRVYGDALTKAQSYYLGAIDARIQSDVVAVLQTFKKELSVPWKDAFLGLVKDYGSLVTNSQRQHVQISDVKEATPAKRAEARENFSEIVDKILGKL